MADVSQSQYSEKSFSHGEIVMVKESFFRHKLALYDEDNEFWSGKAFGVVVKPGSTIVTEQYIFCQESGESGELQCIKNYGGVPLSAAHQTEYTDENVICKLIEPNTWAFVPETFIQRATNEHLIVFGLTKIQVKVAYLERREDVAHSSKGVATNVLLTKKTLEVPSDM